MADAETPRLVRSADVGGTHVTVGTVDTGRRALVAAARRTDLPAGAGAGALLDALATALMDDGGTGVDRWSIAFPGPFDYPRGVAWIEGLDKLESLYDVDVRAGLSHRVPGDIGIVFLNDAHAHGLGEWWVGAARGHRRVIAVTIGTGLGSVFLDDGVRVTAGAGVPPNGWLYAEAVGNTGTIVDEVVSSRGIRAAYRRDDAATVRQIADRARAGDVAAAAAFADAARALSGVLSPWIDRFDASCVVVGGSIARSWDLLAPGLEPLRDSVLVARAARSDDAPLLGAAQFAVQMAEGGPHPG